MPPKHTSRIALLTATICVLCGCAELSKRELQVRGAETEKVGSDSTTNLPFGPRFQDHRPIRESLSSVEIEAFKAALAKISFPQPGGTVEKLMPGCISPSGEMIGDVFGDPNGLLAVDTRWYDLSEEYELVLSQEHYSRGFVDRSAEVKRKPRQSGPNQIKE